MLTRRLSLIILLLSLSALSSTHAQRSISKGPESTYFGNYKPRAPKSLKELPARVKQKVENHLKARFGEDFFSKLSLSGGQIVDFDDLYRIEPEAKNYRWKIFAYGLTFLFVDQRNGLKAYHARILLDSDGNVLQEIDLPEVGAHPEKANIISLADARKIAATNKFPGTANVAISYDAERGSLVWTLQYRLKGSRYAWIDRIIRIDAHAGTVLSIGSAEKVY